MIDRKEIGHGNDKIHVLLFIGTRLKWHGPYIAGDLPYFRTCPTINIDSLPTNLAYLPT